LINLPFKCSLIDNGIIGVDGGVTVVGVDDILSLLIWKKYLLLK
jgi:hypothetical protein